MDLHHIFIGHSVRYRRDEITVRKMYKNRHQAYSSGTSIWSSRANYQLAVL